MAIYKKPVILLHTLLDLNTRKCGILILPTDISVQGAFKTNHPLKSSSSNRFCNLMADIQVSLHRSINWN